MRKLQYFLILLLPLLASCDSMLNDAAAGFVKAGLIEACGKEDKVCIKAVKTQFEPCQKKYRKEWHAYMNAGLFEDDDKLLEIYTSHVYSCIVDADGDPYFVSNTKK